MKHTVYMGWDSREPVAYDVARASILRRTDPKACRVVPLELGGELLGPLLTRPVETRDGQLWCPISEAPMATEFAVSRFAVPFLKRKGWAAFTDCDVIIRADVADLFALADPKFAVQCVKHEQAVRPGEIKMGNQPQTAYSRKNWSSVVLWNCSHPAHEALTVEALNTWPGRDLHAFRWLPDELIGELPREWNHLVGVDPPAEAEAAKLLHYTLGGPWLAGWAGGPMDAAWTEEAAHGR